MRFSAVEKRLFCTTVLLLALVLAGIHLLSDSNVSEDRSGNIIRVLPEMNMELDQESTLEKLQLNSKLRTTEKIRREVKPTQVNNRRNISNSHNKDFIVVGIPTIERPKGTNYLEQTLDSLLTNRVNFDRVIFVVYIGDTDKNRVEKVKESILEKHSKEVEKGLIHIIHPAADIYPDWEKDMKITLGDPRRQVKWRSKQNLDQAYLMNYAYNLQPKYYLSLEDDVLAVENYLETIYKDINSKKLDYPKELFEHKGMVSSLVKNTT
ncbi:alpha-1,3-mannosyl-glycoprotein 4-beta-N-acetylglucosaminyltransferase A-like isoform X2 [Styela clava]